MYRRWRKLHRQYSQWYVCSRRAAETLSLLLHPLPQLQLSSYSNATTEVDADRPPLF